MVSDWIKFRKKLYDDPRFRIALCGYEGEHDLPPNWTKFQWSSKGAYKGGGDNEKNAEVNRHLERIWFSPHCKKSGQKLLLAAGDKKCG